MGVEWYGEQNPTFVHPDLDLALVGAAVGTGYTGWKVRQHLDAVGKTASFGIYEKNERVGGRFLSKLVDSSAGALKTRAGSLTALEFGGMRVFPDLMPGINEILTHFSHLEDFSDLLIAPAVNSPDNFYYDPQAKVNVSRTAKDTFYSNNHALFKECMSKYVAEGNILNDITVQDLIINACGKGVDGFGRFIATDGYEIAVGNVSAQLWEHDSKLLTGQAEHHLLKMGWQTMVKMLITASRTSVNYKKKLDKIEVRDDGLIEMGFTDGTFTTTKRAYITMQPYQFAQVDGLKHLAPLVEESLSFGHAFKIFMQWDEKWWGGDVGKNIANTIMGRQVFLWDDYTIQIYQNGGRGPFNFTTLDGATVHCLPTLTECKWSVDEFLKLTKDNQALYQVTLDSLAEIYGMDKVPTPSLFGYKYWPTASSKWKSHVNQQEVMEKLRRPFGKDVNVWYGNSMTSQWQGWAEGALSLANMSMPEILASFD